MDNKDLNELPVVNIRLVDAPSLSIPGVRIRTADDAIKVISNELRLMDRECVGVLNLNVKGEIINFNITSVGGIATAELSASNVFKSAILSNAAAVILFHNHPSGDYTPSEEDLESTKRIAMAGYVVGVKVLDHIIVANGTGNYYSMKADGAVSFDNYWLSDVEKELFKEEVSSYKAQSKKSFREEMAERFVAALEEDPKNWKRGWMCVHGKPVNAVTGREYNGINTLWLNMISGSKDYADNRWATFKQIQEKGWKLEPGSKGAKVEYYFPFNQETKKAIPWSDWNNLSKEQKKETFVDENGHKKDKYTIQQKVFTVFNGDCIKGIEPLALDETRNNIKPNYVVDAVSKGMDVEIIEDKRGDRAYYSPSTDKIHLPECNRFDSDYDYACTALHELGHATGHVNRLNRDHTGSFGSEDYAKEELVAEIASCFMGEFVDVPTSESHYDNHAAYIQGWANAIRDNKNYLFTAIKQAEQAADYMIEHGHLHDQVQSVELSKTVVEDLDF